MKANKYSFTEQDIEDIDEFCMKLMGVVEDNCIGMKLTILTASLALVLSDISKIVEQVGINKYQFLKSLLSDTMQVMSVDLDGNEKK